MVGKKRPTGCPPKYKTPEEMQDVIDSYFQKCEGKLMTDKEGRLILDKWGRPIYVDRIPPTVTGLALALGFTGRQALLNYQDKPAFVDTVTRAKSRCEAYAEARLYDKDGSSGAQFSLRNNFRGWNGEHSADEDTLSKLDEVLKKLDGK